MGLIGVTKPDAGMIPDTAERPAAATPTIAELFQAHYAGIARLAAMLGADDPEDVAQEAFARLYRRQAALRDPDAALSYVRAIVCNLTRNRARHLSVARRWLSAAQEAAGQTASYEEPALAGEEHSELRAALAALPPRQRQALVLRYWLDLPYVEIAEAMGVSVGTVKAQLSRGTDTLARKLEGSPS
jgi:RNA polymerase sigma-70 factor (sigma-E family)